MKPHLEVGYVSRCHGLSGEVAVKTFDPGSQSLFELDRVLLRLKSGDELELVIDSVRETNKEILIVFEGLEGRNAADKLRGATVLAFREDLEVPAEGEYFQGDLIGLDVYDEAGKKFGVVEGLIEAGPVPNLVIRGEDGAELLLPFADEFVPTVEMEKRRLTIRRPEYTEEL